LRSRSSSATKTVNGQDCNGSTLSAPDAEFLIREAARADEIRIGLEACYKQYDSIQ
jgi:nucleoid-associated protein YgaU